MRTKLILFSQLAPKYQIILLFLQHKTITKTSKSNEIENGYVADARIDVRHGNGKEKSF